MAVRIELQPAFLLHSRPYRDTSVLLDFHTRDHGRLTLLGKGLKRPGSKLRGIVQSFTPLLISWTGKSSLKTLTHAEAAGMPVAVKGQALFSAMYLNELLCRLLHEHEGDADLFALYTQTLARLACSDIEPVLRQFELELLEHLGYGISFAFDAAGGDALEAARLYQLEPEAGFVQAASDNAEAVFRGGHLLLIEARDFSDTDVRQAAKQINRIRLGQLLGDRPLKSRRLFSAARSRIR